MGVRVCYTRYLGPHHLCGGKGQGQRRGVRGSEGSKGSEGYVILGFRVPTTCDHKKFNYFL